MAKKTSFGNVKPKGDKRVIQKEDATSFDKLNPSWRFSKCDKEHDRWFIDERNYKDVLEILESFEGMTWHEIKSASGGKKKGNGSNSHNINVANFTRDAQKRLEELKLDDNDQLFSLRRGNLPRILGILSEGVLQLIWFDRNHEVCPSNH